MSIIDRWNKATFAEVADNAKQEVQATFQLLSEIPHLLRLFSDFVRRLSTLKG